MYNHSCIACVLVIYTLWAVRQVFLLLRGTVRLHARGARTFLAGALAPSAPVCRSMDMVPFNPILP